jgi:uncharacterized HhH-GPD family protein
VPRTEFEIVDNCPVPREIADEVKLLKKQTGATLNSCDRSPEAEPLLKQLGKMSQRQLFEGFVAGRPGFNPANPPGRSTHERRNDGAAYPGRAGARLEDWQVGMDWSDPQAVVKAASKRGWIVTVTYPTNAREAHHLNFRKSPELRRTLKRGSKGKTVLELTETLVLLRSPKTGEPYLEAPQKEYDTTVVRAVKRFQEDYHQKADGKFGSQTATQLAVAVREQKQRERRLYERGDEGIEVERLTRALAVLRNREGKTYLRKERERFDVRTENAVKRFQAEHRLDEDGIFGPKTRTKLYRALERQNEADRLAAMRPTHLHFTGDEEADRFLAEEPLALLVGFALDQQVTVQKAFAGPLELRRRLGRFDAKTIARTDLAELEEVFRTPPAIHRFPASMAKRVQEVCSAVVEDYGGRAERIWLKAESGEELERRLRELPGFGAMKTASLVAVLGKRFGIQPPGWEEVAPTHMTLGDVDSPEALERYQRQKRAAKAERRAARAGG